MFNVLHFLKLHEFSFQLLHQKMEISACGMFPVDHTLTYAVCLKNILNCFQESCNIFNKPCLQLGNAVSTFLIILIQYRDTMMEQTPGCGGIGNMTTVKWFEGNLIFTMFAISIVIIRETIFVKLKVVFYFYGIKKYRKWWIFYALFLFILLL